MATVLKEAPKASRPGRTPTHPYDEWFDLAAKATADGGSLKLTKGEDFKSSVRTMRHNMYRERKRRELDMDTVVLTDDKGNENALSITINQPRRKAKK